MTIGGWLLPKRVHVWLAALFDHLRKTCRFNFQKFHCGSLDRCEHGVTRPTIKKSARELRQGGSDYRCCIPALAGFVSPQSIAPDGTQTFSQESQRATANSETFDEKIAALYAPAAESAFKRAGLLLAEWEIRLYARYIGTVHVRRFAQPSFALCSFRRQQMTSRRMRSQHLATSRDFKTLGY
jgi:hypothetical protein